MSSAGERLESDLDRIIADYLCAQDRGDAPPIDEVIECHPEHAAKLREFFAAEGGMRRLSSDSAPSSVEPIDPDTSQFGDYEIIELIARGGMGAVYKARQISLDRIVALKMILAGRFASPEEVDRLRREAHAVAALEHPHIVPIHEVGEHDGIPFFSMQYVEGGSLREKIGQFAADARAAARLLEKVASAVHEVHERGILHRDLKPGNVLLDRDGTPKISDFGLAKHLEDDQALTVAGSTVGTPHYMSPEQATGRTDRIAVTSDVYGLGAILYHLLVGHAPFHGESSYAVLRKVQEEAPQAIRSLNANVPRDLATICHKCLEKDARRRYATAAELATDLRRFLDYEPIAARPTPLPTRAILWCRRNPAAVVVLSLLTVIAVGSFVAAVKLGDERDAARTAGTKAEERLRASLITEARALRYTPRAGRRAAGLRSLKQAAAILPGTDVRSEAIAYLALADMEFSEDWQGFPQEASVIAFDAEYEHYARGDKTGGVSVRKVQGDVEVVAFSAFAVEVDHLLFSPSGEYLAVMNHAGSVSVFRWRTGEMTLELTDIAVRRAIDFHPTREELVLSTARHTIGFYDVRSGAELRSIPCHRVYLLTFDPGGNRLAVVRDGTSVSLIDIASGGLTHTFGHPERVFAPSWSPDGRRVLVPCEDRNVYCWDAVSGETVRVFGRHEDKAIGACFTSDSRSVISIGYDRRIRVWDARSGDPVLVGPGDVRTLRMASVGRHFGYTAVGTALRLARLEPSPVLHTCDGRGAGTHRGMDIDPRSRMIVTSHGDGVRLWNLETGGALAYLPTPFSLSSQFGPSGNELVTCGYSGLLRWPITLMSDGQRVEIGPPERLYSDERTKRAVLDPVGERLAVITEVRNNYGYGAFVHVFDWDDLRATRHLAGPLAITPEINSQVVNHWGVHSVALSKDGRWMASAPWQGIDVVAWDLTQPQPVLTHLIQRTVRGTVIFSPRGTWLVVVTGEEYQFFRTGEWDSPFWIVPRVDPEGIPGPVAIRPDEELIALVQNKTEVALFDSRSRRELARLASPRDHVVHDLRFSPDGRYLVAVTDPIEVWDLHALEEELFELGLHWNPESFSPRETAAPDESAKPITVDVDLGELSDPDLWPEGTFTELSQTALRHCDRRLQDDPEDADARFLRARLLARLDRVLEALEELDLALETAGPTPSVLEERARLRERAGLDAGAIADYGAIIAADDGALAARVRRAALLIRRGETLQARSDIDAILKAPIPAAPLASDTAWLLIIAASSDADVAQAEFLARSACADRDRAEYLRVLAAACYRARKFGEALRTAERAVGTQDSGRGTTLDLLLIGLSHQHLGAAGRALPFLSRGLDWQRREHHGRPIEELGSFLDEARRIVEAK